MSTPRSALTAAAVLIPVGLLLFRALLKYIERSGDGLTPASLPKIISFLRGKDFVQFMKQHRQAYRDGARTGDYVTGVINYYTIMSEVITVVSGPFWHFVPMYRGKSRAECHHKFHHTLCEHLGAEDKHRVLELGCGYMEMGRQVAQISGAKVVGLTMADAEIVGGTSRIKEAGLSELCSMVQGDYHELPFGEESFDMVFGVYTLKYSARLQVVINEAFRVLKPGGKFISYEILVSDSYDQSDAEHYYYVENISASTCMPPLWPASAFRQAAKDAGFVVDKEVDLCGPESGATPWYDCFTRSGLYQLLMLPGLLPAVRLAERLRIMGPGFGDFFEHCLFHPTTDFVKSGRLGIVTGAVMMTWTKP